MDLTSLHGHLSAMGDTIALAATDQDLPGPVRDFLTSVPEQRLVISLSSPSGIALAGSVLTITGTVGATWPIAGQGDAQVSVTSAEIRCTDAGDVTGILRGKLPLAAARSAAVTMRSVVAPAMLLQAQENARPEDLLVRTCGWKISIDSDLPGVSPIDLILLGRAGAASPVPDPPGLNALRQQLTLQANGFGLVFYPGTGYDAALEFKVSITPPLPQKAWTLIDGVLTVDGIGLACTIRTTSWSAALIGAFKVGQVHMQLVLGLTNGTLWTAALRPAGSEAFPDLAALAGWLGGSDSTLQASTTQGLEQINLPVAGIAISSVSLQYDWAAKKLAGLQAISLITVGPLMFDVALLFPDVTIAGSLHAGKAVLVRSVLGWLGIPGDYVPANMKVTAADFAAMPLLGSYRADLSVDLKLSAGPLTIEEVCLSAGYSAAEGFSGLLSGIIGIGPDLRIGLLAGYGAERGWEFSGCTEPGAALHILDLLSYLDGTFKMPPVPEAIKKLDLTDVQVDYQTGTGEFRFTCTGRLEVHDTKVLVSPAIIIKPAAGGGYHTTFGGSVTIGGEAFELWFDQADGRQMFAATYSHAKDSDAGKPAVVSLHNLITNFCPSLGYLVPAGLDIALTDAWLFYLKPAANAPGNFAVGVMLSAKVDLSELPLVGDRLPPGETLAVDGLQIGYASAEFAADDLGKLAALPPKGSVTLPPGALASGVSITAKMRAADASHDLALALPATAQADGGKPQPTAAPPPAAPAGKWIEVRKQLGVVQINRVGLLYQDGALLAGLDAAITLGPLALSLDGLCFGSTLSKFEPRFGLSGLGLAYASGPLTISGALLRVPVDPHGDVDYQFDGAVQVSFKSVELAAIGSYARLKSGQPSLFIFVQVEAELGGPPAFVVEGLLGGFGYNRELVLPAPAEVAGFPLLALGAKGAPSGGKPQTLTHVLDVLEGREPIIKGGTPQHWIKPSPGVMWLAVGVEFTSFELVRTTALLIAELSDQLTFALLGRSVLQLPQQAESDQTYAYIELGIKALLQPQQGYFGLTAILSPNSYVIAPECHLTGGFAVAAWFGSNPHAGDFVVTLGGYHPAFPVPGHYPVVPRLGFSWAVTDTVTISGSAYAAVTTSCVMAGGRLDVIFQDGGLRAWFSVETDLLIGWRPFHFTGHFAVSIGVSYALSILGIHKTLSVSVGASMDLSGPPTAGTVTVSIWVVSFTVQFGATTSGADSAALRWPEFRELLPPAGMLVIQPTGQLQAMLPAPPSPGQGEPATKEWVVRAAGFSFSTLSAVPASHLRIGSPGKPAAVAPEQAAALVDIKPMNLAGVTSTHWLAVYPGDSKDPLDLSGWSLSPRTATVPDSLWGKPPAPFSQTPARPTADVLADRYVGYDVEVPPAAMGPTRGTVPAASLASDTVARAELPVRAHAEPGGYQLTAASGSIIDDIGKIGSLAGQRTLLHAKLAQVARFNGPDGALRRLGAQAAHLYSDYPMREASTR